MFFFIKKQKHINKLYDLLFESSGKWNVKLFLPLSYLISFLKVISKNLLLIFGCISGITLEYILEMFHFLKGSNQYLINFRQLEKKIANDIKSQRVKAIIVIALQSVFIIVYFNPPKSQIF